MTHHTNSYEALEHSSRAVKGTTVDGSKKKKESQKQTKTERNANKRQKLIVFMSGRSGLSCLPGWTLLGRYRTLG